MRTELNVGDYVLGTIHGNLGVIRRITEKRRTGYSWVYPGAPAQDFWSENSNDPFFEHGWHVIRCLLAESAAVSPILGVIDRLFLALPAPSIQAPTQPKDAP